MADKNSSRDLPENFNELHPIIRGILLQKREKERAYEDVRTGKAKGRIDFNGNVTIKVDAVSSVIYPAGGSVTYVW